MPLPLEDVAVAVLFAARILEFDFIDLWDFQKVYRHIARRMGLGRTRMTKVTRCKRAHDQSALTVRGARATWCGPL